jgi:osmotically-inducible protein OsmY
MSAAAEEIEVTTRSGVVTLEGRVMSQAEKDTIEASAKRVSGVLSVVNNLEVEP